MKRQPMLTASDIKSVLNQLRPSSSDLDALWAVERVSNCMVLGILCTWKRD